MKVKELIEKLQDLNPDALVTINAHSERADIEKLYSITDYDTHVHLNYEQVFYG